MDVTIEQYIRLKSLARDGFLMRKNIVTNIIPRVGDMIEDSVWKNPGEYKVCEVTINYQQNYILVTLETIIFEHDDKEVLKKWHEMVKCHEWETIGEVY